MRRWVFSLVIISVTLLTCEGVLQVAKLVSRPARRLLMPSWEVGDLTITDVRLGRRGNPDHLEHDARGYRNKEALSRSDVVVLGDSHAYGAGVAREEAWPTLLGAYNMALPSYGPVQSFLQLPEALALKPQKIIVSVYLGNDFFDVFAMSQRLPGMASSYASPELIHAADDAERRAPFFSTVRQRFAPGDIPSPAPNGLRAWISRHVALYGLARATLEYLHPAPRSALLSRDFAVARDALTPSQRRRMIPVEAETWKTILTPAYRHTAMDDRDPRIRLGVQGVHWSLIEIARRCHEHGVQLVVVLLPTKESVFHPRLSRPLPELDGLWADEQRLRRDLLQTLHRNDVRAIDALASLQMAATQPYFEDVDGHPNATGHRIIADLVR